MQENFVFRICIFLISCSTRCIRKVLEIHLNYFKITITVTIFIVFTLGGSIKLCKIKIKFSGKILFKNIFKIVFLCIYFLLVGGSIRHEINLKKKNKIVNTLTDIFVKT